MAATGWKNAIYGLLLLGGLGALVAVPGVVSWALPAEGPPLHDRLDIGYGASIQPPPGGRLDLADARPGSGDVVLLAGEVRVELTARSFHGDPAPVVAHARDKLRRDDRLRPAESPQPITTTSGVAGELGSLVSTDGSGDSGCYAILAAHSVDVVVLATPVADCGDLPGPVRAAITSIEIDTADAS